MTAICQLSDSTRGPPSGYHISTVAATSATDQFLDPKRDKLGIMKTFTAVLALAIIASASGYRSLLQVTPQTNFKPVTITASSPPFDISSVPITPSAPYSQRAFQCNLTGDSRYPPFASGTYPLTVRVPVGQRVRVIFANGNLNGATTTMNGEPGVIVQQGGSPIVQQSGSASPIVQKVGSPIVQSTAPPAAQVVQQGPTVMQQAPAFPQSPIVQQAPASPVVQQTTPSPTSAATTPSPTTRTPASPVVQQPPASPVVQQTPAGTPAATPAATTATTTRPASPVVQQGPPSSPVVQQGPPSSPVVQQGPPSSPVVQQGPPSSPVVQQGRKLQQDTVPGGPNNGLVEYVALASSNTVPGFVVPNTQFGVPYVEFTASAAAAGQTATFQGLLESAQVVGGVPLYPFRPNPAQSPECQVNVNFVVA